LENIDGKNFCTRIQIAKTWIRASPPQEKFKKILAHKKNSRTKKISHAEGKDSRSKKNSRVHQKKFSQTDISRAQ